MKKNAEMSKNVNVNLGGFGCSTTLFVVAIVLAILKLTGEITLSWWYIALIGLGLPALGLLVIFLIFFFSVFVVGIIGLIAAFIKR
jgi:hypothetical protein